MLRNLVLKFFRFLPAKVYARLCGVKYGKNCFFSTKNWSSEPYLIEIGHNVQITNGVSIHTHGGGHVARKVYPNYDLFGKVVIKDWAYIGAFSQIMPGVTIGEGSLVAAGSIVTKSVPDGVVVAGNPARIICLVDDYVKNNLPFNVETKGMSYRNKKKMLLSLDESRFIIKRQMPLSNK